MITAEEFSNRRRKLMGEMAPNSIAIVSSANEQARNRDVEFPFRQDSDFYYLSGFAEPESVMVLLPDREGGEFVLFCRERNKEMEIWHGRRAGPEGCVSAYGADEAFAIADIDEVLPDLIESRDRIYYAMGNRADFDAKVISWVNAIKAKVRTGARPPGELVALDHLLHEMRLFKSSAEVQVMKKVGIISANAHARAMRAVKPGMAEYQLEAEYMHEFMREGCRGTAYSSIVGGGDNACILHYTENDQVLKAGDLVLVDAGGELDFYASDITRTFPVDGHFTKPQKALYEIVLAAQVAAIEAVQPGKTWNDPHIAAVRVICEGLLSLCLLDGDLEEIIEKEAYKDFYMHRTGHWLGMDVHDVGDYKVSGQWRELEPGMVLTVEPGIYVAPDNEAVEKKWRGIGIRIEDDVLVTEQGNTVLTAQVPKTVDAIEALMQAKP